MCFGCFGVKLLFYKMLDVLYFYSVLYFVIENDCISMYFIVVMFFICSYLCVVVKLVDCENCIFGCLFIGFINL